MAETKDRLHRAERVHLTQVVVSKANGPAADKGLQTFYRDNKLLGLALRVTAGGARSFVLETRIKGRQRRMTLGRYPYMNVATARKRAFALKVAIAEGGDPVAEKRDERHELTFGDLADTYLERHARVHKRSWKGDELMLGTYLAAWRGRRLSTIRRDDVARLHGRIGRERGHYAANRCLSLIRTMFNKASTWGYWADDNPATQIQVFHEQSRERYLSDDELRRVNNALLEEPDWRARAYFPLLLLLGTRKSELLSAQWADVDLANRTLKIPITKTGHPHLLPLPSSALAIIEGLPSRGKSSWLFPGRSVIAHMAKPSGAWIRIRDRAGLPDVRIHDLRRTLGSRLAIAGNSLPLIGKVLNHSQPSTTSIYARLNLRTVRAALEENAEAMARTLAGEPK